MASKKKKKTAQKAKARPSNKTAKGPKRSGKKTPPKKGSAKQSRKAAPQKARPAKNAKGKPSTPKKASAAKKPSAPKGAKPKGAPPKPKAQKAQKAKAAKPTPAAPRNAKVKFSAPRAPKSTIRTPEGAEELKQKLGALSSAVNQVKSLKRTLNKSFYDIGQILREIRDERLYEVKGYGSFEAFVEREIDLGKQMSMRIVQIVQTFLKEAALAAGIERLTAALEALEGDEEPEASPQQGSTATGTRSPIPLHKQ